MFISLEYRGTVEKYSSGGEFKTEQSHLDWVNLVQHWQPASLSALSACHPQRQLSRTSSSTVVKCMWLWTARHRLFLCPTQPCSWSLLLHRTGKAHLNFFGFASVPCAPAHVGRPHGEGELGTGQVGEHTAAHALALRHQGWGGLDRPCFLSLRM